jgi:hypothetical protein
VQADHPNDATVTCRNRHQDKRLKALFFELGHVLEARIPRRALTNERGLPVFGHPPGEALAPLEHDLAGKMAVRLGGRTQNEPVSLEQVNKARMDGARLRKQAHDRLKHLIQLEH